MNRLVVALAALLAVGCRLPDLSKIKLASCVRDCNGTSNACLAAEEGVPCREADACFDLVEQCFDDSTECSDACATNDKPCQSKCGHEANDCAHQISTCVDYVKSCSEKQATAARQCLSGLVECVATCAADAEAALRR
jgi:hypothetical protein